MNVLISIIVPCFNSAETIAFCLESLVKQTYCSKEIICVDDCSSDETNYILTTYAKKYSFIKVIRNKFNKGPAVSRNEALKIASGSFVAFCDSDDWYDLRFLEKMYLNIMTNNSDITMCNYVKHIVSKNSRVYVDYLPSSLSFNNIDEAISYSKASLCLLLCKKSLFENLLIPDLRNGEDMAIVPCLEAKASKISFTKEYLYHYRIRNSSCSNSISDNVYLSLLSSFEYVFNNLPNNYIEAKEFIGIKTVAYGSTINAIKSGQKKNTINKIINSFEKMFPLWHKNPFLKTLSRPKRLYLFFLKKRMFFICRILANLHTKLSA